MLDLKKLEKEFDEALAKETPESLQKWLLAERLRETIEDVNLYKFNAYSLHEFSKINYNLGSPLYSWSWGTSLLNTIAQPSSFMEGFYSSPNRRIGNPWDFTFSPIIPLDEPCVQTDIKEEKENNYALAA